MSSKEKMKKYILAMLLVIGNEFASPTQYQNSYENRSYLSCLPGYHGFNPGYVPNAFGFGENSAVYCVKNGSYYQGVYAG